MGRGQTPEKTYENHKWEDFVVPYVLKGGRGNSTLSHFYVGKHMR